MKKYLKRDYLLLALLLFLFLFRSWLWSFLDRAAMGADENWHILFSLVCLERLEDGNIFSWLLMPGIYYPPLSYLITSFFYLVFEPSLIAARLSQVIFWVILAYSVYGIGKCLFDRKTGLVGAFFALTAPAVMHFGHRYYLDLPLAAMVSLSLYLLFKTENFKNTKYSYLFGAAAALGMLTKWNMFLFIAGALSYVFVTCYSSSIKRRIWRLGIPLIMIQLLILFLRFKYPVFKAISNFLSVDNYPALFQRAMFIYGFIVVLAVFLLIISIKSRDKIPLDFRNMIKSLAVFMIIVSPNYLFNFENTFLGAPDALKDAWNWTPGDHWQNVTSFFDFFPKEILSYHYTFLFILGISLFFILKKYNPQRNALLLTLFLGVMVFLPFPNHEARYLLPNIVPIAIFSTFWLFQIRKGSLVIILIFALVGMSHLFGFIPHVPDLLYMEGLEDYPVQYTMPMDDKPMPKYIKYNPVQYDYPISEAMKELGEFNKKNPVSILFIAERTENENIDEIINFLVCLRFNKIPLNSRTEENISEILATGLREWGDPIYMTRSYQASVDKFSQYMEAEIAFNKSLAKKCRYFLIKITRRDGIPIEISPLEKSLIKTIGFPPEPVLLKIYSLKDREYTLYLYLYELKQKPGF